MLVVVARHFVPKGFGGLTVFPFIFVSRPEHAVDTVYINHEKIHIRQQLELFVLLFFLWYAVEFLLRWVQTGSRAKAYHTISFEREAYENEKDLGYLTARPSWNFLKYRR